MGRFAVDQIRMFRQCCFGLLVSAARVEMEYTVHSKDLRSTPKCGESLQASTVPSSVYAQLVVSRANFWESPRVTHTKE